MATQIETVSNEVTMLDVFKQRQRLHDSAWMLKEALFTLQERLQPIIDTRPMAVAAEQKDEAKEEWHCEFADLLNQDAETIHDCLIIVRSIFVRLQI